MLRCFLILLVFFSIVTISDAQIISVQPDTTLINPYGTIARHGFAWIYNSTSDSLHLRWHRVNTSVHQSWISSVCDNNACYSSTQDSADFIISPNDSGFIELTVNGYNEVGNGVIDVQIYRLNDSINVNSLAVFSIHVSETNSITENQNEISCKTFPNPANDFIYIQSSTSYPIREVKIFDLKGKIVSDYFSNNSSFLEKIYIESLLSGKYFVEIFIGEHTCYTSSFIK